MKFLCRIAHHWRERFNYVYPRAIVDGVQQGVYLRTCRRCSKAQVSAKDPQGTEFWIDVALIGVWPKKDGPGPSHAVPDLWQSKSQF